jgi:peroxin-10
MYRRLLTHFRPFRSTQTLGQEYTDLVLIDDTHSMLSRKRRLAYVFLVVGLPYLSKRARLGWGNVRRAFQAFDRRAHAQAIRERMRAGGAPSAQGAAGASGAQMADLRSQMRRAWSSHGENILMCAGFAARLHLMLFYLTGRYFTFPLRLSGAHLRYNRAQGQPHARYTILGLFLALQLSAETATGLLNLLRHRWVRHAGTDAAVEDMRVPCQTADEDVGSGVNRKCALCMERVSVPSATACGHLFCWSCIIPWCQMRAECPLCRQPCQPQSIVRLYQF